MFGEHAAFIIPAYIITFAAMAIMTVVIILQYRSRKSELEKLDVSQSKQEQGQ